MLPADASASGASCHRYEERKALLGSSRFYTDAHSVAWALGPGDIVAGAVEAGMTVAMFLDRLEPIRQLGAPIPVLDTDMRDLLSQRVVDKHDAALLLTTDDFGVEQFLCSVSPLRLVQVAGRFGWTLREAHDRMAALVPIGLTLEYSPEACFDDIVTWQDLLVITEYLDGQEPAIAGTVSEAHILAGAREIDQSPAQVRARIQRYAPLCSLIVNEEQSVV
jgi:hypothetical protein